MMGKCTTTKCYVQYKVPFYTNTAIAIAFTVPARFNRTTKELICYSRLQKIMILTFNEFLCGI